MGASLSQSDLRPSFREKMAAMLCVVVVTLAGLMNFAVAVACAPGLADGLIRVVRRYHVALPGWFQWGCNDAVQLPKLLVTWTLSPILIGCGMALIVERWRAGDRPSARQWTYVLPSLAFVAWSTLCTWHGICPMLGWERVWALACVVTCGCVFGLAVSSTRLAGLWNWLVVSAVVVSAYSLCQHFGLDPLGWDPRHDEPGRTISSFGNPDFFATWLAAIWPFVVWRVAVSRTTLARSAWGAACGTVTTAIVFSFTRGAWLVIIVESVLLCSWVRPRLSRAGLLSFLTACSLLTWGLKAQPHANFTVEGRVAETVRGDASVSVRLALWKEALCVLRDHPWTGTGPGTFSYAAMPYRGLESPENLARWGLSGDPHNVFLEALAACGLPGGLLCLLLAASPLLALRRTPAAPGLGSSEGRVLEGSAARSVLDSGRCGEGNDADKRYLVSSGVGFVAGHLLVRMTLPSLWLAFTLLAASFATVRRKLPSRPLSTMAVALVALGIAGAVGAFIACRPVASGDYHFKIAQMAADWGWHRGGLETDAGKNLLAQSLGAYDLARREADGARLWSIEVSEGRLFTGLLVAASVETVRGRSSRWRAFVVREGTELLLRAVRANPLDPYVWIDLADFDSACAESAAHPVGPGGRTGDRYAPPRTAVTEDGRVHTFPHEAADFRYRAILAANAACVADPWNAAVRAASARYYVLDGRLSGAVSLLSESLALAPWQPGVRVELAKVLFQQGHVCRAKAELKTVLTEKPGDRAALRQWNVVCRERSKRSHR